MNDAYSPIVDVKTDKSSIAASIASESSVVHNNPMFSRHGLDASGLTEETDAINNAAIHSVLSNVPDSSARHDVVKSMHAWSEREHDATAKYEAAELKRGALDAIVKRANDNSVRIQNLVMKNSEASVSEANAMSASPLTPEQIESARMAIVGNGSVRDVNGAINDIHRESYTDYRALGMTHDEAYDAASKLASSSFKYIIGNLDGAGYLATSRAIIEDKLRPEASWVPVIDESTGEQAVAMETVVKDGKRILQPQLDRNGNKKLLWDDTKVNPSGMAWCTSDELSKLLESNGQAIKLKMKEESANLASVKDDLRKQIAAAHSEAILMSNDTEWSISKADEIRKRIISAIESGDSQVARDAADALKDINKMEKDHENKVRFYEEKASTISSPRELKDTLDMIDRTGRRDMVIYTLGDGGDVSMSNLMSTRQAKLLYLDNCIKNRIISVTDKIPGDTDGRTWGKYIEDEKRNMNAEFTTSACAVLQRNGFSYFDEKRTEKLSKSAGHKKPAWQAPDSRVLWIDGKIANTNGMVFVKDDVEYTADEINDIIGDCVEFQRRFSGTVADREKALSEWLFRNGGLFQTVRARKLCKGFFTDSYKTTAGSFETATRDSIDRFYGVANPYENAKHKFSNARIASTRYLIAIQNRMAKERAKANKSETK